MVAVILQMQPSQPIPPPMQTQISTESASIKIALNGSIGLEVTPPEENSSPSISSNTGLLISPPHQVSQDMYLISTALLG